MMPGSDIGPAPRASFRSRVLAVDPDAVHAVGVEELMLNVGLRCNMACAHCHLSCSPARAELMAPATLEVAVELGHALGVSLLDVTGGEPTLYPHLRELLSLAADAALPVRVRTNLVALTLPETADVPGLLAENRVAVLASLPGVSAGEVKAQRGAGAWERSLAGLRELARVGYGAGDGLTLDIAYNPPIGALGEPETLATARFRESLAPLGVRFDRLRSIANVPVGRFRDSQAACVAAYASLLADAFNPRVVRDLVCRRSLEVAWDGTLWDCDFNLAAGVPPAAGPRTAAEALHAPERLRERLIGFGSHCFACTAGAGSS